MNPLTRLSRSTGIVGDELVFCQHCPAVKRSAIAAAIGRWIGRACPACGGYGCVPAAVFDAWCRQEDASVQWREYERRHPVRRLFGLQ